MLLFPQIKQTDNIIVGGNSKSGEALDWYQEVMAKYGITEYLQTHNGTPGGRHAHWATGHNNAGGMMAPPGEGATDKLREYILSLGGEYRNETPMINLIKENDRVVGAIAKNASGYIRINAANGVIVATGGYARNDDMMRILQPHTCKHYAWHESPPTHSWRRRSFITRCVMRVLTPSSVRKPTA